MPSDHLSFQKAISRMLLRICPYGRKCSFSIRIDNFIIRIYLKSSILLLAMLPQYIPLPFHFAVYCVICASCYSRSYLREGNFRHNYRNSLLLYCLHELCTVIMKQFSLYFGVYKNAGIYAVHVIVYLQISIASLVYCFSTFLLFPCQ
jgi:hypothetical protein